MSLGLYAYNLIVVDVFKIFPTTGYTSRYFITKKKKKSEFALSSICNHYYEKLHLVKIEIFN
jgi:hypothetical protein